MNLWARYSINIYESELTGIIVVCMCVRMCMCAQMSSIGSWEELVLALVNSCGVHLSPMNLVDSEALDRLGYLESCQGQNRDVMVVHMDLLPSSHSRLSTWAASQQFICFLLPNAATGTFFPDSASDLKVQIN